MMKSFGLKCFVPALVFLLLAWTPLFAQLEVEKAMEHPVKERIALQRSDGKYGFQGQPSGRWYVPPQFQYLPKTYAARMVAAKNGLNGVIDSLGNTLVPFEYEQLIAPLLNVKGVSYQKNMLFDYVLAQKNQKWGAVSFAGKVVKSFEWEQAEWINDSLCLWGKANLLQVEGPAGGIRFSEKVDGWTWVNSETFPKALLWILEKEGKKTIIDDKGRYLLPWAAQQISWCRDGMFCVKKDNMSALYSYAGDTIIPPQIAEIMPIGKGLVMLVKERQLGQSGVVDRTGAWILPCAFAEIHLIRETDGFLASPYLMARKLKERTFGLYHMDGRQLAPARYAAFEWYSEMPDLLFAQLPGGGWHLLRGNGQLVHEKVFESLRYYQRCIVATYEGQQGFLMPDGRELTPFHYQSAKGIDAFYAYDQERRLHLPYPLRLIGEARSPDGRQVWIDQNGKEY